MEASRMSRVSPSSHEASLRMARVRQKGTSAEIDLRKALHSKGMRYRLHVQLLTKPRRVADIVFSSTRIAIFVDGCFWHGCPEHASWPKSNADFWRERSRPTARETPTLTSDCGLWAGRLFVSGLTKTPTTQPILLPR